MIRRLSELLCTFGTLALIAAVVTIVVLLGAQLRRHAARHDPGAEVICEWCPERGDEPHSMQFVWSDKGTFRGLVPAPEQ